MKRRLYALAVGMLAACTGSDFMRPASKLVVTNAPSATAGSRVTFPVQPAVRLQDESGANVSLAGVSVSVTLSGGGTLIGTATATTNASGVAKFDALAIGGEVGARTLTFSSGSLAPVSVLITVAPGAPARVTPDAGSNQTAMAGTDVPTAPSVRVSDDDGNAVPNAAVQFTVASGGGTVTGATAVTTALGIASVGSWKLGTTGLNTLEARVAGITGWATFLANASPPAVPCGSSTQLAIDRALLATLAPSPCTITDPTAFALTRARFAGPMPGGTHYYDLYVVDVPAGAALRVEIDNTGSVLPIANVHEAATGDFITTGTRASPATLNNLSGGSVRRFTIVLSTTDAGAGFAYSIVARRVL